ncbi:MAG: hypothetical protein ACJAVK_002101, partial [Akkermansiaceae bacterium]
RAGPPVIAICIDCPDLNFGTTASPFTKEITEERTIKKYFTTSQYAPTPPNQSPVFIA